MTEIEITSHALAEYIEWVYAKERVRFRNRGLRGGYGTNIYLEFDPLAATCLGMLIHSVVTGRVPVPQIKLKKIDEAIKGMT